MSDNEKVEEMQEFDSEGRLVGSKKIIRPDIPTSRILIEKGDSYKDDEDKEDAMRYRVLRTAVADDLTSKYGIDVFHQLKDPEDMLKLAKTIEGKQTKRKTSSGTVQLRTGSYDPDESPLTREYDTPKEMLENLYRHALDPKSPYYTEAKEARKQLKEKFGSERIPNMKLEFTSGFWEREPVRELGKKFTHGQYTRWLKEKVEELARNAA